MGTPALTHLVPEYSNVLSGSLEPMDAAGESTCSVWTMSSRRELSKDPAIHQDGMDRGLHDMELEVLFIP